MYRLQTTIIVLLALLGRFSAKADYASTILSFNPAGYWPLNETSGSPQAEVATNLGSLGPLANAYYLGTSNNAVIRTTPGALTDGDTAAMFIPGPSPCLAIPRTTSGLVIRPPFSVECWVYQTNSTAGNGIVACGRNSDLASSVYSGFTLQTAANGAVTFNTYNRNGVMAAVSLTSPIQTLNAWHHVVATYNTNSAAVLYVDGAQVATTTNGYFPSFAPEVQIASQGGLNTSLFTGSLDEIAIYTNALSAADVAGHFTAGITISPPTAYKNLVLASNPPVYLRLDEPVYTVPAAGSYATAINLGTVSSAANGAYQPGTTPGIAGPPFSGFGANNYACAFNGLNAFVDCGASTALLPTGSGTNSPVSVVAWFKCNPADFRFQGLVGHGDSAWRIGLNGNSINGNLGWNPGFGSDLGGTISVNDGKWHCVAAVLGVTNGRVLYIDGVSNASSFVAGTYQASTTNVVIGGAPDYVTARGLGATRYFAGTMCQVSYFTNALSATDVSNIFNAAGITIRVQPLSQAVAQGASLSLSVTALGPGTLGYQWYKGVTAIGGANSASYTVASAAAGDAGSYSVVVTNTTDSLTSGVATVSVITTPPPSSSYASAVLALNPVGYWPLSETSGSAFAVNYGTASSAGSGRYQYGAFSGVPGPAFSGLGGGTAVQFHRWGGFIDLGTSISLLPTNRQAVSVAAWFRGPNDIRTQTIAGHGDAFWRCAFDGTSQKNRFNPGNGTEIAGTQNMNDGLWHLLVGVSDGTTNALYIDGVLQVTNVANAISTGVVPLSQSRAVIGGAPDYGAAFDYPVASTTIVRFWDGDIAQVALFTNSLSAVNVASLYGAAAVPPAITLQPNTNQVLYAGAPLSLTVRATGSPTLLYQWYRGALGGGTALSNGGSVSGATSTNLMVNPLGAADTNFYVVVANSAGSVTSLLAAITVIAPPTNPYPLAVMADGPLGYWRLGETNVPSNGTTAYDFWAGHNGMYSNVLVGVPGYRAADADTAVLFGTNRPNSYVASVQGVDFSRPANNNSSFSVECWVSGAIAAQTNDAGIITKGTGAGGEQFNLDTGTPATHAFRFFVRNSAGANGANATATIGADPGVWHHVVGVCDQPNGRLWLYVDGKTNGSPGTVTINGGIFSTASLMTIGARQSGAATPFDLNFVGSVDEVAIYNYALTPAQVQNHYFAAGVAPTVLIPSGPTNVTVSEGSNVSLPSSAYGSPTLRYQWYDNVLGGPLPGKTNSTLTLSNVTVAANDSHGYYVVVSNAFGTATSPTYVLSVVSGPPQIITDLAPLTVVYAGRSASLFATVGGTPPFSYQWQHAGTNLVDSSRITGSLTNKLTITGAISNDAGTYQLFITNAQGNTMSSPGTLAVQVAPDFSGGGVAWNFNTLGTASVGFSGNTLTLTDGAGNERSSAWYNFPLYIGAFRAFFTYQDLTAGGADGVAFVLQNDPNGLAALGDGGGSLGYVGISPSVALELNIYSPNSVGYAFRTNSPGTPYTSTSPVSLSSGSPIDIGIIYDGATMQLDMTNQTTLVEFHTSLPVGDLKVPVGTNTAFVGFTGATGGAASQQTVSNFSYLPLGLLSAQRAGVNAVLISWPASLGGYVLQSSPSVDVPTWTDVPGPFSLVSGQYQLTVAPDTSRFYRLNLVVQ